MRQIMYGVLYAISPEIFPAKHRGTGNGLTAMATRLFGVLVGKICLRLEIQLMRFVSGTDNRVVC
jgi:hypothetical protein